MFQTYWTIQKKDGQKIGPIPSSEVREALRKGSIDLFDWVYKDNSKLTIRIIDVDEIFKPLSEGGTDSIYKEDEDQNQVQYDQTKLNSMNQPDSMFSGSEPSMPTRITRNGSPVEENSSAPSSYNSYNRQKNSDKRFYVSYKSGALQGPISAQEIFQKYFKHSLPKDMFVHLKSSPVKVKMEDFIQTFAKYHTSSSKDIMLNNLFKEKKSSKNLNNQIKNTPNQNSASIHIAYKILGTLFVLVLLILAVLIAYPRTRVNLARSSKSISSSFKKAPMSSDEEAYQLNQTQYPYQSQTQSPPPIGMNPYLDSQFETPSNNQTFDFSSEMAISPSMPNQALNKTEKQALRSKKDKDKDKDKSRFNKKTSSRKEKEKDSKKQILASNKNNPSKLNSSSQEELKQFMAPGISSGSNTPTTPTPSPTSTNLSISQKAQNLGLNKTSTNQVQQTKNTQRPKPNNQVRVQSQAQTQPQPQSQPQLIANANSAIRANKSIASTNTNKKTGSVGSTGSLKDRLVPGNVATLPNMQFSQIELNICPNKCSLNFYSGNLEIKGTFFKAAYLKVLKTKSKATITGTVTKTSSGYGMIIQNIQ